MQTYWRETAFDQGAVYWCKRDHKHKRRKPERVYVGMTIDHLFPDMKGVTHLMFTLAFLAYNEDPNEAKLYVRLRDFMAHLCPEHKLRLFI